MASVLSLCVKCAKALVLQTWWRVEKAAKDLLYYSLLYKPHWSSLSRISKITWVRSSYIWFIVVPLAAYLLKDIGPNLTFTLGSKIYVIPVGLPFSWQLFYFGAVSFAVGALLYTSFSPPLVRDYTSFSQYQDEGRGSEFITKQMLHAILHLNNLELGDLCLSHFIELYTTIENPGLYVEQLRETASKSSSGRSVGETLALAPHSLPVFLGVFKEDQLASAFWFARDTGDQIWPAMRYICFRLYCLGLILHLVIAIQGFSYVCRVAFASTVWSLLWPF
ncbi:hypothetical protein [Aeoliella sp.]|uniref:hypothetical protein n=1 Tax=Aeoliella sp. TaxID=2795800 RepID=UPI003CCC3AAB